MTSPAIRVPRPCGWWGSLVLALALAVSNTLCPATAHADEPTIDEVRYHPTELPPDGTRTRLLLTGAGVALGWYGVALGTSYLSPNAPNARDLRLPVVGPWMALGDVRCGPKERNCRDSVLVIRTVLGVLSGVGQAGGLLGLVEGLFLPSGAADPAADIRPSAALGSPAAAHPPPITKQRARRSSGAAVSGAAVSGAAVSGAAVSWTAVPVVLPDGAAIELVGHF